MRVSRIIFTLVDLTLCVSTGPLFGEVRAVPVVNLTNSEDASAPSAPAATADPTQPTPPVGSERFTLWSAVRNIPSDQAAMWTSPFRTGRKDLVWLLPIAAGTAVFRSTDKKAARKLGNSDRVLGISTDVSRLGSGYADMGAAAVFYAVGKLTGNERAREIGLLAGESIINAVLIVDALKLMTNRQRPDHRLHEGRFWGRGESFPSGHAGMSWALAAVLAEQYPSPWVRVGVYGWASAVALSRFTDQKHYPSDIVVGSAIGYLVGHYVVKHHRRSRP
ncbi:MAG TPA: phosphatase PAP2 family protein [Acidobacteriota bacterium]|jgi:membrane-associated phospholipid phosphatase